MRTIPAKTIMSAYSAGHGWFGFNYNMNIYKGCSHGCIYCDSRSECYQIENFDEVRVKEGALDILARELRSKKRKGVIGTGAMSDPYNHREEELKLTEGALALIHENRFGVGLATKSSRVLRDLNWLLAIQRHSPVLVKITITTADDDLARKIEPRSSLPSQRYAAIKELNAAGIPAGILLMPVLPFLEDSDEQILEVIRQAQASQARFIYPGWGVTLRQNQREWFFDQLDRLFPGMKEKYMQTFGTRYQCESPRAPLLKRLFQQECRQAGILFRMAEIVADYQKPYQSTQMQFFC